VQFQLGVLGVSENWVCTVYIYIYTNVIGMMMDDA
jgi:hypothetical protein